MKKTIYSFSLIIFFLAAISFNSCKKDSPAQSTEGISGAWTGTMVISGESFGFTMTLTQTGTALTGNFTSDDQSMSGALETTSKVVGNTVTIYFKAVDSGVTYELTFTGTVNSAKTSITAGTFAMLGVNIGTWTATKNGTKSASVSHDKLVKDVIISIVKK